MDVDGTTHKRTVISEYSQMNEDQNDIAPPSRTDTLIGASRSTTNVSSVSLIAALSHVLNEFVVADVKHWASSTQGLLASLDMARASGRHSCQMAKIVSELSNTGSVNHLLLAGHEAPTLTGNWVSPRVNAFTYFLIDPLPSTS